MFHCLKSILLACFLLFFIALPAHAQPAPETIASQLQANTQFIKEHALAHHDLRAIYAQRHHKPIWNTESKRGRKGIVTFLKSLKAYATYHGLNTKALPFNKINAVLKSQKNEYDHLTLEILVTDLLIKLTRRIRGDDVDLSAIYRSWNFPRQQESYLLKLIDAIQTGKIDRYFKSLPPSHTKYKRLTLVLRTYRAMQANGGWNEIPYGATIKENRTDERLPLVYARLKAEGYDVPDEISTTYTYLLQEIVMLYQNRNGLEADGEIGTKTIRAMNVSAKGRVKQIIANMERLRHLPHYYEGRRIEVNMASSMLKLFDDKEITYKTRVIVGSRWRKTPFINSEIKTLIFNPSWYVPRSIASNDILKKLKENPRYLQEMGYNIEGNEDDPQGLNIDWANMTAREFKFFLRQSPSEINALGKVKFNFENPYAVYLHGTPKMDLFDEADRHLSSGCVRLKEPAKFAQMMLEGNVTDWNSAAIEDELGKGKTRWVTVVASTPIAIIYDSVYFPSADSPVSFNRDIYRYDKKLINALFGKDKPKETI